MSGKTKILVMHMKEVVYTGIFIFLGIIFLILLAIMFLPKKSAIDSSNITTEDTSDSNTSQNSSSDNGYMPGIYTAALEVSGNSLEMQVIIEQSGITDVSFTHLDEAIETMYPLFTPVLESISSQLQSGIALEDITYEDNQKYTASILLDAIWEILDSAAVQ